MLANVVAQITTRHEINDQVEVFSVLKSVVHVDQKAVSQINLD